jgi:hypothetical protein
MRFLIVLFVCCAFILNGSGQELLKELQEVRTLAEAQRYADSLPQLNFGFMHTDAEISEYQERRKKLKPGDTFKTQMHQFVVVSKGKKELYRFRLLTLMASEVNNADVLADSIVEAMQGGTSFTSFYESFANDRAKEQNPSGDLGWVDPDYFTGDFKDDILGKQKGDIFLTKDERAGWYNIVEMTHAPKLTSGHYVLFYAAGQSSPELPIVNHEKQTRGLQSTHEFKLYTQRYPGVVALELLHQSSNETLYRRFLAMQRVAQQGDALVIDSEETRYRVVKDTTVELFSIQYIYLNGEKMSRDERNAAIHDIYDQFHANTPFDSIVTQYWPDHDGRSVLRNIDGALLADDLVEKVRSTIVGQLFVARVGQSYFLGVPLEKPKKRAALLVLSYPKPEE